jgi:hypothetical protein
VKRIDLLTGRIKVALDQEEKRFFPWEFHRNKTITFSYRNFRFFQRQVEGFRLGYAASIYRAQNVAVEGNTYLLYGGPEGAPSAVYAGLGLVKRTTHVFGQDVPGDFLKRADRLEEKHAAHTIMRLADEERLKAEVRAEHDRKIQQPRNRREIGQDFGMSI